MARTSSGFKKVQTDNKQQLYNKLKYLSRWLFDSEKLSPDPILEDEKEFNSNIKYRLYNNFLNNPRVIHYLNTHLNDIYLFFTYDPLCLLKTFGLIVKLLKIKNQSELYFSKFQQQKRDLFVTLIDKYSKVIDYEFNKNEIFLLYKLYEIGIIKSEDLEEIEEIVSGTKATKSSSPQQPIAKLPPITQQSSIKPITKSSEIIDFCNKVGTFKRKRSACSHCSLYNKQHTVLDTNIETIGTPADIILVANDFPTEEDILNQTIISKDPTGIFKTVFDSYVNKYNIKYVITNAVLCYPAGVISPADAKKALTNCKSLMDEIHSTFQPKLTVLMGSNILKSYGIKEKLSDINGKIISNRYLCMPSLEEAAKNKTGMDRFEHSMICLEKYLKSQYENRSDSPDMPPNLMPAPQLNITNTRIEPGDTLFNIEILNDQVIYILLDQEGNKKIIIEDIQFPIYIKTGTYRSCDYIDLNMDARVTLTAKQKQNLSMKLSNQIKTMIQ